MDTIKISFTISIFLVITACSSSEFIVSGHAMDIKIDGSQEDWEGRLKYLEDKKLAVGFLNDNENLYFCLVSSDKATVMKIMSLGLTVWFNPKNGDAIGLQYPQEKKNASTNGLIDIKRNNQHRANFNMDANKMLQNQNEYLILDQDKNILHVAPISNKDGVELKITTTNQQFIYEARIPIANNPLAQVPIDVFPNEMLTITFESGEINMDLMKKNKEMRNVGAGGGMGGQGGKMRGRAQRQSSIRIEKINFSVDLRLFK